MKTVACYILHYGKEWLEWSICSVKDFVDYIFIFYSPTPSHGHSTSLVNPETRDDLFIRALPYNVSWFDTKGFQHEGLHREFAINTCRDAGAEIILVVDADEIWEPSYLRKVLSAASQSTARTSRVYMRHFWRSVKWVCDDPAAPTRIVKPNQNNSYEDYINFGYVFHMGYAQSPAIIRYKESIHGHKAEWRENWYNDKFLGWKPGMGDVHPTNINYWNPIPYDDDGTLYNLIGDHPYFEKEIIE